MFDVLHFERFSLSHCNLFLTTYTCCNKLLVWFQHVDAINLDIMIEICNEKREKYASAFFESFKLIFPDWLIACCQDTLSIRKMPKIYAPSIKPPCISIWLTSSIIYDSLSLRKHLKSLQRTHLKFALLSFIENMISNFSRHLTFRTCATFRHRLQAIKQNSTLLFSMQSQMELLTYVDSETATTDISYEIKIYHKTQVMLNRLSKIQQQKKVL